LSRWPIRRTWFFTLCFLIFSGHLLYADGVTCTKALPSDLELRKQIGQMFIVSFRGLHFLDGARRPKWEDFKKKYKGKDAEKRYQYAKFYYDNRVRPKQLEAITKYFVGGIIVREEENLYRADAIYIKKYDTAKLLFPPVDYWMQDKISRNEWLSNLARLNNLSIQNTGVPLLIASDAEPGSYIVFGENTDMPISRNMPSVDIPSLGKIWTARRLASFQYNTIHTANYAVYLANSLRNLGVHLNLAPNAGVPRTYFGEDTNEKEFAKPIYHPQSRSIFGWAADFRERDFGPDPKLRLRHVNAFMNATRNVGVIPVIKHFPGNYSEEANSCRYVLPRCAGGLPAIIDEWINDKRNFCPSFMPSFTHSYEEMIRNDLYPFVHADNKDVVMVAHSFVPNLNLKLGGDPLVPIMFSEEVITKYLKQTLGYELVVTDDMAVLQGYCMENEKAKSAPKNVKTFGRMCKISQNIGVCMPEDHPDKFWLQFQSIGDIGVRAVKAGVDLFIVSSYGDRPQEQTWDMTEKMFRAVKNGELSYCRVHDAYSRVIALKRKVGLISDNKQKI